MNYAPAYQPYNFPAFPAQTRAGAYGAPVGYPPPQPVPQSVSASVPAPQAAAFLVQPVTSREEALAVIADPLAAGVLMPDLGHGVIYLKRFNAQTGASDFAEFPVKQETPPAAQEVPEYVTLGVFTSTVERLREEIAASKKGKAVKKDDPDE